jgi:hypothetical protein
MFRVISKLDSVRGTSRRRINWNGLDDKMKFSTRANVKKQDLRSRPEALELFETHELGREIVQRTLRKDASQL